MKCYLSGTDHGAVLITTRLAKLEQLGESQQLGKVNKNQAKAIFQSWYRRKYGKMLHILIRATQKVEADN